ncbi:unnamed protein product, partial [Urochloa humidicola]
MKSLLDRRNSWTASYPNRGQTTGTSVGRDLPIAEDGEGHVSRCEQDRFWLSRFIRSPNGGEMLIGLRSAHAYPTLASISFGRGAFIMDSGAGFHVTSHRDMLQEYMERDNPMFPEFFRQLMLVCADGNVLPVHGMGNIDTGIIRLEDVLHVPAMVANLVSVRFLTHQLAVGVHFWPHYFNIRRTADGVVLGGGIRVGDIYHLHTLR